MRRECQELFPRYRLQRKPRVNDPGMHHGTCVKHVPWWMSGSPTGGGRENVPGIPGACATRNFMYLVRGPWNIHSPIVCLLSYLGLNLSLLDSKIYSPIYLMVISQILGLQILFTLWVDIGTGGNDYLTLIHWNTCAHYNDVTMSVMASEITSITIVYSTVYSGPHQRKHQSSASLAFVRGIHQWPVTNELPAQRASNMENVSIWWCHHVPPFVTSHEPFWIISIKFSHQQQCIQNLKFKSQRKLYGIMCNV